MMNLNFSCIFEQFSSTANQNMRFSFLKKYKHLGFDAIPLRTTLTTIYLEEKDSNVRHHNHLWRHWDIIVTVDVIETSWSSLTSLKGTSKHIGMVWLTLLTAKLVRKLVDALRSVNHKGLHQGWETSFYLKKVLISQVIISQVMFFFLPIYIPRALNTGTCLRQVNRF